MVLLLPPVVESNDEVDQDDVGVASKTLFLDWTCVQRQIYERQGHTQRLQDAYYRQTTDYQQQQDEEEEQERVESAPSTGACAAETTAAAAAAQAELVLITGPSGVGKTGLALTLQETTRRDGGCFCRGKFEQPTDMMAEQRIEASGNSYSPFAQAMTEFCVLAAQRGRQYVTSIRTALEQELDASEIQILEEGIPALRKITCLLPPKAAVLDNSEQWRGLKGLDAEKRYMHIFSKLIEVICSPDRPMVMVIDDLQWADRNSIALIKALVTFAHRGFLLVCTTRLEESSEPDVKSSEPNVLSSLRSDLQESNVAITEIKLENMSESSANEMIAGVLQLTPEETVSLSNIIYKTTSGNLFFIMQFLSVLRGENLLRVSSSTGKCSWKEHLILETFPEHHTVLDLLTKKILHLPQYEQKMLQIASCLGGTIYECLLAETAMPSTSVGPGLRTAKDHGLITFDFDSGSGSFIHGRIQEAAYSLIPENKRVSMHLDIGRRLWIWLSPQDQETHLFTIVNQIIRGHHLLDDQRENVELAALMLRAGRKAARMSSFKTSSTYFNVGMKLLGRKHWKRQYQLSFDLYNAAAKVEYYNGNLDRVDSLLDEIFENANSTEDKLRAHFTQIYSLGSRDDMKLALAKGLEVLKTLGEPLPYKPWKVHVSYALGWCRKRLRNMTDDQIMNLPLMEDNRQLVAMRLLNTIFMSAFSSGEELVTLIVTRMVGNTLRKGLSAMSCVGFAILAYSLGRRGHADEAYRFGRLGLRIMEKFQAKEWQCRVSMVYGDVFSVKHPLQELIQPLQLSHRAGLVAGDVHCSMVCASFQCRMCFFASVPLADVVNRLEDYKRLSGYYGQKGVAVMLSHQLQLCFNFMGRASDPLILTGEAMNEKETMDFVTGKHPVALAWLLIMKHVLAVYFHDLQGAYDIESQLSKMKTAAILPFVLHAHLFLEALTTATLSRTHSTLVRSSRRLLEKLKADKRVTFSNNENKILLVEAEIASARGDCDLALSKYQESIEAARRECFFHEQALACEKAGQSLLEWGERAKAREYFQSACSLYSQWGADAKVMDVSNRLERL